MSKPALGTPHSMANGEGFEVLSETTLNAFVGPHSMATGEGLEVQSFQKVQTKCI